MISNISFPLSFTDIFLCWFLPCSMFDFFFLEDFCKNFVSFLVTFFCLFYKVLLLLIYHSVHDNVFGSFHLFVLDFLLIAVPGRFNFSCIFHFYNKKKKTKVFLISYNVPPFYFSQIVLLYLRLHLCASTKNEFFSQSYKLQHYWNVQLFASKHGNDYIRMAEK